MLIFRRSNCIIQHLVSSHSVAGRQEIRLRQDSRNLCTEQSPKESDDTRCCTNPFCPPEDEHNSGRNM